MRDKHLITSLHKPAFLFIFAAEAGAQFAFEKQGLDVKSVRD